MHLPTVSDCKHVFAAGHTLRVRCNGVARDSEMVAKVTADEPFHCRNHKFDQHVNWALCGQ